MPASAPPLSPFLLPAVAPPVGVDVLVLVDEVKMLPRELVAVGSLTFEHLVSVPEFTQHESVEFGELAAQYEHRLGRLLLKPQLLGSFWTPGMQFGPSESFGRAQVVKSARIWLIALLEGVPQRDEAAMVSSLVAKAAYTLELVKPHDGHSFTPTYASLCAYRPCRIAC